MKVRATKDGFYNHMRRKAGQVFNLIPRKCRDLKYAKDEKGKNRHVGYSEEREMTPEEQFSSNWMEKYEGPKKAMRERVTPEMLVEPEEDSEEEMDDKPKRKASKSVI